MAQDSLEQSDVSGKPAGELAGSALGEEARGHVQQLGKQLCPETRHHPLPDCTQEISLCVVEESLDTEKNDQPDGDAVEHRPIVLNEGSVQQVTDDHRKGQPE